MKTQPYRDSVTLYQAIGRQQLAALIESDWQCVKRSSESDRFCFLKLHQRYAEMIARQSMLPERGEAWVVRMELPLSIIGEYPLQTVAYEEHLEYQVPVASLPFLGRSLLGRVCVVAAFRDQHSYSVPRAGRFRDSLTA